MSFFKSRLLCIFIYILCLALWKELLQAGGAQLGPKLDLSSLAKVTDGYTQGHILQAIQTVLNSHRLNQQTKRPLTAVEFIPPLARLDPVYKEEEEAFKVGFLGCFLEGRMCWTQLYVCILIVDYVCIFCVDRRGTAGHLWAKKGHERPGPVRSRQISRKGKQKVENYKQKGRRGRIKRERKRSEKNGHSNQTLNKNTVAVHLLASREHQHISQWKVYFSV